MKLDVKPYTINEPLSEAWFETNKHIFQSKVDDFQHPYWQLQQETGSLLFWQIEGQWVIVLKIYDHTAGYEGTIILKSVNTVSELMLSLTYGLDFTKTFPYIKDEKKVSRWKRLIMKFITFGYYLLQK